MDGEDREDRLDGAGGAHQVAGQRLRRADADLRRPVAEDRPEGLRLAQVAQRRRRPVRVDHVDPLGLARRGARAPGPAPGGRRRPSRPAGSGPTRRRPSRSRSPRRRSSRRAPSRSSRSSRMTAPAPSPRTKPLRVMSNGREIGLLDVALARRAHAPHVREADVDQLVERRLGGPGDRRHDVAAPDQLGGLADVVGARRAGRDDAHVRPADPGLDRDLAGRRVGEHVGDEERADRARPLRLPGLPCCPSCSCEPPPPEPK